MLSWGSLTGIFVCTFTYKRNVLACNFIYFYFASVACVQSEQMQSFKTWECPKFVFKLNIMVYNAACHICTTVYFLLHTEITSLSQDFWNQTLYCVKINTIDWEQALIWIQFQQWDPAVGCVLGGLNVITQHNSTKFPQAKVLPPTHLAAPCEPRD